MPANPSSNTEEDDKLVCLPGFPGYRTRPGRTGLDYLDSVYEMGHFAGLMFRKIITGSWRKQRVGPHPWVVLLIGILSICFIPGQDAACPAILIVLIIGVIIAARERPANQEEEHAMDWIAFIQGAYQKYWARNRTRPVFHPPASEEEINAAEETLGIFFPETLREMLAQTNGFSEERIPDQAPITLGTLLMPVEAIVDTTAYYRTSGLRTNIDFTEMIFCLNSDTDGIVFAIRLGEEDVYAWYPNENVFRPVSASLENFLTGWASGNITM